jgi:hypothetical protein
VTGARRIIMLRQVSRFIMFVSLYGRFTIAGETS